MREDIMEHMLQYRVRARRQVAVLATLTVISALTVVALAFALNTTLPLVMYACASICVMIVDAVAAWRGERQARRELEQLRAENATKQPHEIAGA